MATRRGGPLQPLSEMMSPTTIGKLFVGLSEDEAKELWQQTLQRAKYQRWAYLDPTTTLEGRMERCLTEHRALQLRSAHPALVSRARQAWQRSVEIVEDGKQRDDAAKSRPVHCWCFGLGGRGLVVMAVGVNTKRTKQGDIVAEHPTVGLESEPTFEVTCPYCTEGREAQTRKDQLYAAVVRGSKVVPAGGWTNSGIPTGFQGWRLETSPVGEDNPELLVRLGTASPANYLFRGLTGRGKTGLTVGLAWKWREEHRLPVLYVFMPRLLAEIRATYDKKEGAPTETDVVNKYATVPVLILDDIGREHITGTGWAAEKIDLILYERHSTKGLVTLITSNDTDEKLLEKLGPAIYWRLTEMTDPDRWLPVGGRNWRDK